MHGEDEPLPGQRQRPPRVQRAVLSTARLEEGDRVTAHRHSLHYRDLRMEENRAGVNSCSIAASPSYKPRHKLGREARIAGGEERGRGGRLPAARHPAHAARPPSRRGRV